MIQLLSVNHLFVYVVFNDLTYDHADELADDFECNQRQKKTIPKNTFGLLS